MRKPELHLVRRAIKERWPIAASVRPEMMRKLVAVAESSDDDRSIVAAIRALLEADKINMQEAQSAVEDALVEEHLKGLDDPLIIQRAANLLADMDGTVKSDSGRTRKARNKKPLAIPASPDAPEPNAG